MVVLISVSLQVVALLQVCSLPRWDPLSCGIPSPSPAPMTDSIRLIGPLFLVRLSLPSPPLPSPLLPSPLLPFPSSPLHVKSPRTHNIRILSLLFPPSPPKGKDYALLHAAPVVSIFILDHSGIPIPDPYEVENHMVPAADMHQPHFAVICTQEQVKVW